MLVQVGSSSLLILTRMIYYAYYLLGPTLIGEKKIIGGFLMSFTTLLYYTNYAKSFYIYTLSSHLFRTIFFERIRTLLHTETSITDLSHWSIHPTDTLMTVDNQHFCQIHCWYHWKALIIWKTNNNTLRLTCVNVDRSDSALEKKENHHIKIAWRD